MKILKKQNVCTGHYFNLMRDWQDSLKLMVYVHCQACGDDSMVPLLGNVGRLKVYCRVCQAFYNVK